MSTTTINGVPITDPSIQNTYGSAAYAKAIAADPALAAAVAQWNASGTEPGNMPSLLKAHGLTDPTPTDYNPWTDGNWALQTDGSYKQISMPGASKAILGTTAGLGGAAALSGAFSSPSGPGAPPPASNPTGPGASSASSGSGSNVAKVLATLGGLLAGNALSGSASQNAVPPQLSQLLDLSVQRQQATNPLFQAANSGMYQMLPTFAKSGGAANPLPSVGGPMGQSAGSGSGGSGLNPALLAALAGAGGVGLGGLLTGTNPYGSVLTALGKLFGGQQGTGAYQGPGTAGYPGDGTSGSNNPLPLPMTGNTGQPDPQNPAFDPSNSFSYTG